MVQEPSKKDLIQLVLKQVAIPVFAWTIFAVRHTVNWPPLLILSVVALFMVVLSGVHHAEVIAKKIGEPYGSLVLALAITVIEVSIIISLMLTGSQEVSVLARDTVFAAVMIILTGMTGLTILIGGLKFREQEFSSQGTTSVLTVLVAISVLTMILPNFTQATPGPFYSNQQLTFVAVVTLTLYGSFLFVQNFRHRSHFVSAEELEEVVQKPDSKATLLSAVLLPVNLFAVVMLAESMAPNLEEFIHAIGAPVSLSGIIIACVVLLPEGISAVKAAAKNQMQRSLNLSLGSALASISLSIPVVSLFSIYSGLPLALGIETESMVLFLLSLFVIILSLSKGKTTILQGIVLLLLFFVYLFITINP
jgi:Ca2+:H+ antiporter